MSNLRKGFAIERMLLFHPRLLLEGIHYLQFVSLFRNFLSIHKHKCELFFLKKKKKAGIALFTWFCIRLLPT